MKTTTDKTPAIGAKRITFDGELWMIEKYGKNYNCYTGSPLCDSWQKVAGCDSIKRLKKVWAEFYGIMTPFPSFTVWQSEPQS